MTKNDKASLVEYLLSKSHNFQYIDLDVVMSFETPRPHEKIHQRYLSGDQSARASVKHHQQDLYSEGFIDEDKKNMSLLIGQKMQSEDLYKPMSSNNDDPEFVLQID